MPRPPEYVCNALIGISLHLYSKPICKVIAHQLPPYSVREGVTSVHAATRVCVTACVFVVCVFAHCTPSPRAILVREQLVNGGLWLLRSWADSSLYLNSDQVPDFTPRPETCHSSPRAGSSSQLPGTQCSLPVSRSGDRAPSWLWRAVSSLCLKPDDSVIVTPSWSLLLFAFLFPSVFLGLLAAQLREWTVCPTLWFEFLSSPLY